MSSYTTALSPKNHELFDNRYELTHETPIASVKAWITIDDIEYTIEKTAQAKFVRKRGSNEWIKDSSDTYKIYIDEIETSTTDYNSWIERNICNADSVVYCLDGLFFSILAECDRKKSRKVLESIVGEIKECDFRGNYSVLQDDFSKGYTIEQIEEKVKNQIKPLKKRQAEIPALIKQNETHLFSVSSNTDFDKIENDIKAYKNAIEEIDKSILGISETMKPIMGERDAIFEIINSKQIELNDKKNTYINDFRLKINKINAEINEAKDEIKNFDTLLCAKRESFNRNRKTFEALHSMRLELLNRKDEIKSRIFSDEKCAYCGQELPFELLEKAKDKFNTQKQKDLDICVTQGKQLRADIDDLEIKIAQLEKEIVETENKLSKKTDITELEKAKTQLERNYITYEDTDEYKQLYKEIEDLRNTLPAIPVTDYDSLAQEKNNLLDKVEELSIALGGKKITHDIKTTITNLQDERRTIGVEIAYLEGVLDKCKDYQEERASIISHRINDKLTDCKIQMWERQKNGDIVPSCIITDNNGVKYATLNNSARIKTCIAIQKLFCSHYNISMPTFIDECSIFDSVNLPQLENQTIYLFASDNNELTVE